jgi:hypothetical protein
MAVAIVVILILTLPFNFNYPYPTSNTTKKNQINDETNYDFVNKNVENLLSNTPTAFTKNCGQLKNDDVGFYAQGGSVWFTDDGVWFELREEIEIRNRGSQLRNQGKFDPMDLLEPSEPMRYKRVVLKQEFVGANLVQPAGRERFGWNSNFFYGNDSEKWCTDVPNYAEVYYENLYDGIDLRYYKNQNGLKYDFIVHPGADHNQIRLRYEGSDGLIIDDDGNLVIITEIQDMIDNKPFIFLQYENNIKELNGSFMIYNNHEIGFNIKNDYDHNKVLIIDPLLEYSTFLDQSVSDWGGIEVDSLGNAVISGLTYSNNFPVTPGAFDTSYHNDADIFVTKFNNNGSALIFSTYIGGVAYDGVSNIAIDSRDFTYITGTTNSWDYPTTQGAYDTTFSNQRWDVFVTKLNPNGSSLSYSTFIHGSNYNGERSFDIFIDSRDCAFVTGETFSSDFPITQNAYDTSHNGNRDVFVLKLNYTGAALDYSTFIGTGDPEAGLGISVDSKGNAYVTGGAYSGFPTTLNAYDTTYNGGHDGFVLKLNHNGSKLNFSTFIGGSQNDVGRNILLDRNENIIVTGNTDSTNFPITNDSFDDTYNGGTQNYGDVFVLILNNTGTSLLYSTYVGGSGDEWYVRTVLNSRDDILISGFTNSLDFPVTYNALIKNYSDFNDTFIFHLGWNRSKLLYSTYIGGSGRDVFGDVAIDINNNIYLYGFSNSADFPTTPNAYEPKYKGAGQLNAFVMKLFIDKIFNISSVRLLKGNISVSQTYSKLCQYTLQVNITNTISLSDVSIVRAVISPQGLNIQLIWNRGINQFLKLNDPNNYITLEPTSIAYNYSWGKWTVNFNLTFNWTYPDEELQNVHAIAINSSSVLCWYNATHLYQVENDVEFVGSLFVKGYNNKTINNYDLVRGHEKLNWSGLIPAYQGTTDIFPPNSELDISIWDEKNNCWLDSPEEGLSFNIVTITQNKSNFNGYSYIINLTRIPPECDATNVTFTIRIDSDNVTFSNPIPGNNSWQTKTLVDVGVTITDIGGGEVKGSSVKSSYSTNNGGTWSNWKGIPKLKSQTIVKPIDAVFLREGKYNRIKWQAKDSVDNGPVESQEFRILIDTENVSFSSAKPSSSYESPTENVKVGITISDITSGVNAFSIEYAISIDDGAKWSPWTKVAGLKNGTFVNVTLNLTFQNGSANRIKWRASDIAGNGPKESKAYTIKVNTWLQTLIPRVQLWSPPDGSVVPTTSVKLHWILENAGLLDITYDLYFDTAPLIKPNITGLVDLSFELNDLIDGETYYWKVIPRTDSEEGLCTSGIWSFTVDTSVPFPTVKLLRPENGRS